MSKLKDFILGGTVIESYSHATVVNDGKVHINLYVLWKYRFTKTIHSTRYLATWNAPTSWYEEDVFNISFVKDYMYDDFLPYELQGKIFYGEPNTMYFEVDKL